MFQNGFSYSYQWNSRSLLPVSITLFNRGMPPYNVISKVKHVKH